MPITGTGTAMGTAIADAIIAANDPGNTMSAAEKTALRDSWGIIATEIIAHFVANGLITTSVTGVTGTGTPGGPLAITAQPGTGGIS